MLSGFSRTPHSRRRRGAAAVELAVAVPMLVLLAGAVVDFGIMLSTSLRLENAVEAGALYGAQSNQFASDAAGIVQTVTQDAGNVSGLAVTTRRYCRCPNSNDLTAETGDVSCTSPCTFGAYGPPRVYVEVSATGRANVLFLRSALGSMTTLTRTSSFRAQ